MSFGPGTVPTLLLAMPDLVDTWFERSVILLLNHDDEGSFGLVVNRRSDHLEADQLLDMLSIPEPLVMPGVLRGGPVQPDQAFLLHNEVLGGEETVSPFPGLNLSSRRETLVELCQTADDPLWIVLGYAGWQAGQLEQELERGSWFRVPCAGQAARLLSSPREKLWDDLASLVGLGALDLPSLSTSYDN
jgi:putative transcriptional regulator